MMMLYTFSPSIDLPKCIQHRTLPVDLIHLVVSSNVSRMLTAKGVVSVQSTPVHPVQRKLDMWQAATTVP